MTTGCQNTATSGRRTGFRASARCTRSTGCSGTRTPGSSPCSAGEKTVCGVCGQAHRTFYDRKVQPVRDLGCGGWRIYLDVEIRRVACRRCGTVKQERLAWLADTPGYTKRFAFAVGRRCRTATIEDVAQEVHLDWKTVKALERQDLREQLRRAGTPAPKVIGIDEVSIRKGHTYRIVVSDLVRRRPIWFGGVDRSEASLAAFYAWLGPRKSQRIRLAVMDMWTAFRTATAAHAPQAAILFDKCHVLRHLGGALDKVRKREYARLSGQDRRFIKGQKYTERSVPILADIAAYLQREQPHVLPKSPIGEAIAYALHNWAALVRYPEDGDLAIDNNAAERSLRGVAVGRKNWLFFGSDTGGRTAAILTSLIITCKRLDMEPFAYLRDVFDRISAHPAQRLAELLPDQWQEAQMPTTAN